VDSAEHLGRAAGDAAGRRGQLEMARLSYARTSVHVEDTKLLLKNDAITEEMKEPVGGYEVENKQLPGELDYLVPKAGLCQRGLLKSLKTPAIPAVDAKTLEKSFVPLCFTLLLEQSPCRSS
jgi:hypothetical protein